MPDDWSWFLSSGYGRDRMLREEVEGLLASASASSARSARLSGRLRTLQGSSEARMQCPVACVRRLRAAHVPELDGPHLLAGSRSTPQRSAGRREVRVVADRLPPDEPPVRWSAARRSALRWADGPSPASAGSSASGAR